MSLSQEKRPVESFKPRTSTSSSDSSLKVPRTPRFAEATSVYSPIEPTESGMSPFADPPNSQSHIPQPQPSDIGFGYLSQNDSSRAVEIPQTPASPLKSALRVPGTPGRRIDNPLSPTFREEQILEKEEEKTEAQQAKDIKVKTRVRMAKFLLRFVNFSCSLIVLSMLCATLSIFNSTRHLATRNSLPPWAVGTNPWPQYVTLSVACVSLFFSILVFWAYWRGGHKRAEKTGVYYTLFAIGFFIFNIIMWAFAAGILQGTKNNSGNQDLWGWSCVDNQRRQDFKDKVDYELVCRLQSWSLVCCIIEVVVETLTITIYSIIFYRYWSKRRLRKSMDVRDRARSDLYLAQLRSQSAPNTPGFGPMSPSFSQYAKSPRFPASTYANNKSFDHASIAEEGNITDSTQFAEVKKPGFNSNVKPFALQAPPIKVHAANSSPKVENNGFARSVSPVQADKVNEHAPVAPGEQAFDAVPIPGAYASPIQSPSFPPQHYGSLGMAVTSDRRIDSPPGSPRRF